MHRIATAFAISLGVIAAAAGASMGLSGGSASAALFGNSCKPAPAGAPSTRVMDWDGSDHFGLAVPGTATWQPGGDNKLHISGDPTILANLEIRDGDLRLSCNADRDWGRNDLHVVLPGRAFRAFAIAGSGDLALHGLNQPAVDIAIAGSGNVMADGKVAHQSINISGSGDADLTAVKTGSATVHIAGSGTATIAPADEADVMIAGSGDVILKSQPRALKQRILGSGSVRRGG